MPEMETPPMLLPPSPSRTSIFFTKLRKAPAFVMAKLRGFNNWVATNLNTTSWRIQQLELLGFGLTMIQLGEFAIAGACWVLLAIIWVRRVSLVENNVHPFGAFGKFIHSAFAVIVCVLLITGTDLKKPDNELWSNFQKPWPWLHSKKQQQQSEVAPPKPVGPAELTLGQQFERDVKNRQFVAFPGAAPNRTDVLMQLEPATYEDDKERAGVDGLEIAFYNNGSREDDDTSIKINFIGRNGAGPALLTNIADCDQSNRVQVISGGHGSTVAQFTAPVLIPGEHHSCKVSFMHRLIDVNTVTAWKSLFGTPKAWSKHYGYFDAKIFRVRVGSKAAGGLPPNSWVDHERRIDFEVQ